MTMIEYNRSVNNNNDSHAFNNSRYTADTGNHTGVHIITTTNIRDSSSRVAK